MKILVTGGQGFIGSHLIEHLIFNGHSVLSVDRSERGNLDPMKSAFDQLSTANFDITEMTSFSWRRVFEIHNIEGVIHLAGLLGTAELTDQLPEALKVNVLSVLPLYDAIAEREIPAVQIAVGNPTWYNTYSITKTTIERIALMYNDIMKTNIAVVRAMNVYGPRQKWEPVRKVVPYFIHRAMEGEPIEIFGNGQQIVDLIHVSDTVKILAGALLEDHGVYDRVFDCGSGDPVTVRQLAEMIKKRIGSHSDIVNVAMRNGEPLNSVTKADLTNVPAFVKAIELMSLKMGIRKTCSWYQRFRTLSHSDTV